MKFDWAQIHTANTPSKTVCIVYAVAEDGETQQDYIAETDTPEWAEHIANALNEHDKR